MLLSPSDTPSFAAAPGSPSLRDKRTECLLVHEEEQMPLITASFTQYVVYYITGGSAAVGMPQDAEIDCFDGAGNRAGAI